MNILTIQETSGWKLFWSVYILLGVKRTLACVNANVIQNGIRLKKSGMSPLGYFLCLQADGRARQISIVRPQWLFCPLVAILSLGAFSAPSGYFAPWWLFPP